MEPVVLHRIESWTESKLGPPQRRHSSPTEMMHQLKRQNLQHRRHTTRLTVMYKIQHNLVDIPLKKYTQPARTHCATEHLAAGRRGHPQQLRVQRSRLQAYTHYRTLEQTHNPNNKCSLHRSFQTLYSERDSSAAALYYRP